MTPAATERRAATTRIVGGLVGALGAGAFAIVIGLPPLVGAAVALVVAAAVGAWIGLAVHAPAGPRVDVPEGRPGTRSDAAWIAWGLTSRGRTVGVNGADRVRSTVRARLARHGLDPDDPADRPELERRFGGPGWRFLAGPDAQGTTLATIEHCLDVLDALDDERGHATP